MVEFILKFAFVNSLQLNKHLSPTAPFRNEFRYFNYFGTTLQICDNYYSDSHSNAAGELWGRVTIYMHS